ncbi:hypothetical protein Y032_0416g1081 [Ancylostoma ceylanicum]|uniref:Saposin B-type domain-containing protein n=1 Tax=Ancylostoma ceylanicum TaxID=53326 RepID=A0A016X1L3_9BILA|nr:hypothetical protein Y032_0416g1081 [Ancylostoma ceylanicum]
MKIFLLLLIAAFGYVQPTKWSECEVCAFVMTSLRRVFGDDDLRDSCPDCLAPEALDRMVCDTLAEDTSDKDAIEFCYYLLRQVRSRDLIEEIMKLHPWYDRRTDRFCASEFELEDCRR